MSISGKNRFALNGKECFLLWVELGATRKVAEHLAEHGTVNLQTGKKFTGYGIWARAMGWVLENPDEARVYYVADGSRLTDDEWEQKLVNHAMTLYNSSKARFIRWIRQNDFHHHKEMYEIRFGVVD